MDDAADEAQPPKFDQAVADSYVGKYIIVGITYHDHAGKEIRQQQMHGAIERASPQGMLISLRGTQQSQTWNMPPDFRAIVRANPGTYTLRGTKEVIKDPDLLATWDIHEPQKH